MLEFSQNKRRVESWRKEHDKNVGIDIKRMCN